MRYMVQNVTVTNWSKDPLLSMGDGSRGKLAQAITYSKQIVADSCDMLNVYKNRIVVAGVDKQIAKDFFSDHKEAVREALEKYFGLQKTDATHFNDVTTVLQKFQQIRASLNAPFDLVVGYIHDGEDIVDGIRDAASNLRHGSVRSAVGALKFIRKGTEGWVDSSASHAQHRIHLNKNSIKSESAGKIARIIVHEASHKFANTIDVAYKWDNLKHNAGGHANLINNADSYAWAGRLMWKRKRGLASGV